MGSYNKIILFVMMIPLFTAGIMIVGLQQASAGGLGQDCGTPSPTVAPDMIDETLHPEQSHEETKVFNPDEGECDFEEFDDPPFRTGEDCSGSGFDDNILIEVDQVDPDQWDETITVNDDAEPGRYHCTLIWRLVYENDEGDDFIITVNQEIWITVPDPVIVHIDIKPQSCPNSINVNSKGVLPVAILGSATFDVNDIDISTLPARTQMHKIEDVATPFGDPIINQFDCTEEGPDGFDDLIFKIPTTELNCLPDGALAILTIDGQLLDGTNFEGFDLAIVINKQGCF